jgi:hypothetical protein
LEAEAAARRAGFGSPTRSIVARSASSTHGSAHCAPGSVKHPDRVVFLVVFGAWGGFWVMRELLELLGYH